MPTGTGKDFATETARAALDDAVDRSGMQEVLAYTVADNIKSQAVMKRLRMTRDESRDFIATYPDVGEWRGIVWIAGLILRNQSQVHVRNVTKEARD